MEPWTRPIGRHAKPGLAINFYMSCNIPIQANKRLLIGGRVNIAQTHCMRSRLPYRFRFIQMNHAAHKASDRHEICVW
ncbi:hypothetical protein BDR07DRAFT_1446643 [Suillus spraguei]|nr:hypothetical protein BDR07DRAFT_1446643 [Suillus spraguei]